MAFSHHRKLLTESADSINATLLCNPWCDPLINTSGYCFISCLAICPTVCHLPFPAAIPPPEYSALYDSPPPPNSRPISPLLITASVAVTLTVLLIGAFAVFKYFRRRSSTRRRSIIQSQRAAPPADGDEFLEQGPVIDHPIWYIRTVGLPPSLISKISVCKYKNGEGLVEGTECSVCLTEFEEDETLKLLPKCSHAFHVACIDTWLRSHTNCPNCRAPIITLPEPITANSDSSSVEVIRIDEDEVDSDDGRLSREIENSSQSVVTESEVQLESEDDRSRNAHLVEEEEEEEVNNGSSMVAIRRSVSVDSLSASKIGVAIADFLALRRLESDGGFGDEIEKEQKRLGDEEDNNCSSSSSSSAAIGSIKRSLSLSGRFFLSKYSISRSSRFFVDR